ncbi:MAG TPA: class I SAM-dependent rRNA methyltransferase [Gammaproteobacteria bacterium]|nr:class I SAM-dependent rRNA methyltransferase [Gammaproteobacteria bacterium]
MTLPSLQLKKNEDHRLKNGHLWIYSNEIDTKKSPLKNFQPGEEVIIQDHQGKSLGIAYVNPHSLITARLFSRNLADRLNADFIQQRLNHALSLRDRLYAEPYYRLVFGESDGLPGLVIDRFGNHIVAQCNTYGMDNRKEEILIALRRVLPSLQSLLWRNDSSIRQQEGLTNTVESGFGQPPEEVTIIENQVKFRVPLWKGQKTGWFFDHRLNRSRLKDYVNGQTVLDVFSYLGGWGIQAATWGAKEVCCIDSSAFACEQISKNAELNYQQDKVTVICEEAVIALQNLNKANRKFDVIILDPPAFIKRRKDMKEGLIAYQRINNLALRLLNPSGIFVSGSCSMHLAYDDLVQIILKASIQCRRPLQIIEQGHQAPDHPIHPAIPETDYLKAIFTRGI